MSILSTGTSALLTFQRALSTVGHNVANAATPGFSRQRVDFTAMPGQNFGFGFVGAGVGIAGITRLADAFQFGRQLDNAAELGRLSAQAGLSARVDRVFSDAGTGLAGPFSEFFDAAQAVSTLPASTAARESLLAAGENLAARLRGLDGQLKAMDGEVSGKLSGGVDQVNRLSGEIARLNQEIVRQQGLAGGRPANDLLDQRERLVLELSGLIGATTAGQDDGSVNVFTSGGQALVVGSTVRSLTTVADPFQPERRNLALVANGALVRLGAGSIGGELGGLLEFRSGSLDVGLARLGQLAAGLVGAFNAQHAQGVDLFGALGGEFFAPLAPRVTADAGNAGGAALTARVADPGALSTEDVVLSFDGLAWTASARGASSPLPLTGTGTSADPLRVAGIELTVAGAPAAGDRFLLRPTAGIAGSVRVAIGNPSLIAAASPLAASASLANLGDARPELLDVDVTAPGFPATAQVRFVDAGNYTLDGAGPFPYDPVAGIPGPGFVLRLDAPPVSGDVFDVVPRGPGSSDNGNARKLAAIDGLALFQSGTVSLNAGLGQLSVSVGADARQTQYALDAQSLIGQQLGAEREALSGVNLDEEAANLLRYQQAYQAAAQIIATADTLFQTVLAAVRR